MGYQGERLQPGSSVRRIPEAGGTKKARSSIYDLEALAFINKQQEEPEHFRLDYFNVQSGSSDIATASIKLVCGG
ncbi:2-isopropylmalate synthase [Klebsiella pneumoniae]|uniref:2-isopropylmalate synthase n=1 Tax=Klebsiella pneumoniae TaxID=573 RepID=A0A3S4IU55_KLEPN|nr:2-isopropylmalate synthase [Klebsiella pneumoniae]